MSATVIQVDHLWKKYRLGVLSTGTFRHDFNRWLHRTLGKPDPYAVVGQQDHKTTRPPDKESARPRDNKTTRVGQQDHGTTGPPDKESARPRDNQTTGQQVRSPVVRGPVVSSPVVSGLSSSLRDDEMWALCDVSFEVKQGEVLGIIGRNGAGKSTLLKILSRVTAPTCGEVRVKGRIASLLEVGTGFHPELTGRENIFLNGAILGMTKAEIEDKLDEIVDFAEIEKFLDTPVKRYSSGMYVRLAFAVAAHLEPEILIVDEVLAVGDMEFQKKCLGKMGDVARGGRTVLFVSHNMATVEALCGRCLLLQDGCVTKDGSVVEVVGHYAQSGSRLGGATINLRDAPRSGSGKARIVSLRFLDEHGVPTDRVALGNPLQLELEFTCSEAIRAPGFGIVFYTLDGRRVLRVQSSEMTGALPSCEKGGKVTCRVEELLLAPGPYVLTLGLASAEVESIDYVQNCAQFEVEPANIYGTGRLPTQATSAFVARGSWRCEYQ